MAQRPRPEVKGDIAASKTSAGRRQSLVEFAETTKDRRDLGCGADLDRRPFGSFPKILRLAINLAK
jgi:hypothetical protein